MPQRTLLDGDTGQKFDSLDLLVGQAQSAIGPAYTRAVIQTLDLSVGAPVASINTIGAANRLPPPQGRYVAALTLHWTSAGDAADAQRHVELTLAWGSLLLGAWSTGAYEAVFDVATAAAREGDLTLVLPMSLEVGTLPTVASDLILAANALDLVGDETLTIGEAGSAITIWDVVLSEGTIGSVA